MTSPLVAAYLADCRARHKTGAVTPETSYYGSLETLLNAVGQKLKKPRVRCFMSLQNTDGNMPDGGLFTQEQFSKSDDDPLPGQKPARGAIKAKPLAADLAKLVAGKQIARYWEQHQQVLATNFREFALIGRDHNGKPARHEFNRLATSEKVFWQLAAKPDLSRRKKSTANGCSISWNVVCRDLFREPRDVSPMAHTLLGMSSVLRPCHPCDTSKIIELARMAEPEHG